MLNPTEMMLLLLGIVILVGGKKLPELGSGLGKGISEFKIAMGVKPEENLKQIKEGESRLADTNLGEPAK